MATIKLKETKVIEKDMTTVHAKNSQRTTRERVSWREREGGGAGQKIKTHHVTVCGFMLDSLNMHIPSSLSYLYPEVGTH